MDPAVELEEVPTKKDKNIVSYGTVYVFPYSWFKAILEQKLGFEYHVLTYQNWVHSKRGV